MRIQGVLVLKHCGHLEKFRTLSAQEARREVCIALVIIPLLSGILSTEASVHLDLTWGMSALQPLLQSFFFD